MPISSTLLMFFTSLFKLHIIFFHFSRCANYPVQYNHTTQIQLLKELISDAKYRPYNWGKFMAHKKS
ncbi:hypothetical protein ACFXTO_034845 [Malus domestica]